MLGKKMKEYNVQVWLVNTGWSGGEYGVGKRMSLNYTRAMIASALKGDLNEVKYATHDIFGVSYPMSCDGVPDSVLNPVDTWSNREEYYAAANLLAKAFVENFEKFKDHASDEIIAAEPHVGFMV